MVELLLQLTTGEGIRATLLNGVKLIRSNHSQPRRPVFYDPSIVIVASGRKKGFAGDRYFTYDPNHYLVLSAPLPFECETQVSDGEPLLGVSLRVDMSLVGELAVKMDMQRGLARVANAGVIFSATPLDALLSEAIVRLLESLRSPLEAAVLGPGIVREIIFRVLCGEQGDVLWSLLGRNGLAAQVHAVLQRMHTTYSEPFDVSRFAEESGMSVSALHHSFKAAIGTSPLQYLKSVRLHKARMLMVHDHLRASAAAERVGYQSVSQFGREFKRLFGATPLDEADRVRTMLNDAPESTMMA